MNKQNEVFKAIGAIEQYLEFNQSYVFTSTVNELFYRLETVLYQERRSNKRVTALINIARQYACIYAMFLDPLNDASFGELVDLEQSDDMSDEEFERAWQEDERTARATVYQDYKRSLKRLEEALGAIQWN